MADVRSLLKAERQSRRITHPHASYTTEGKLLCNLCDTPVKSEAQWSSHLHSTQHNLRSQREKEVKEARGEGAGKKRKAESLESPEPETDDRKRVKPAANNDTDAQSRRNGDSQAGPAAILAEQEEGLDEADLAAFDAELAALEKEANSAQPATSALNAQATISAAPLTAEELAAQVREEANTQRNKRDEEVEGEKDDAARVLEEEFEEMEGLEERVKKLRARREALRRQSEADGGGEDDDSGQMEAQVNGGVAEDIENVDDDDEDYDDDEWAFGGK